MLKITITLGLLAALSSTALAMGKKTSTPAPASVSTPAPQAEESIWVGKSDQAKSCSKARGIELDKMASALEASGVKILAKRKLHDGKMRIQMCGVDKGDMNGFMIAKKDLEKAVAQGFQAVPAPPQEN